jgi:hypothetical protein
VELPDSPFYVERRYRSYRDKFTLVWMVFRECNFDCAYCYKTAEKMEPFDVDAFIEAAAVQLPQPYRIAITGGEPLMLPWMIELCQKIGAAGNTIEMQTNFSVNVREFIDNTSPDYIDIIETSYHPAARRRWGGDKAIENYAEDLLFARSKGFTATAWMIDDPRIGPDRFIEECKILSDAGITPMRKRYTGDECGLHIGDAIFVLGLRCLAGYRGACMWENFDITVCDHDRTKLGNLFTGVDFKNGPEPCAKDFCGCLGREWLVDEYHDEFYGQTFGGEYEPDKRDL